MSFFDWLRKDPGPEREISKHDIELSKKLKEIHRRKQNRDIEKERLLGTMKETQAILKDAEKLPSAIDADKAGSERAIKG